MSTSTPIIIPEVNVSYEPAYYDAAQGEVVQGRYFAVADDPGGAYKAEALVQYENPSNAVDGAVAANGKFVLYQGDPAAYEPVVVAE